MGRRLHKKKVDYIAKAEKFAVKSEPRMTRYRVEWVIKRFIHYAVMMLVHGYPINIWQKMIFTPYYIRTMDFEKIEKQYCYLRSSAIHGIYFYIKCEGKLPDKYKATFKPSFDFRKKMEKYYAYPELTYRLTK